MGGQRRERRSDLFHWGRREGRGERSTAVMAVDEEERQCVRPCRGKERGGGGQERREKREREKPCPLTRREIKGEKKQHCNVSGPLRGRDVEGERERRERERGRRRATRLPSRSFSTARLFIALLSGSERATSTS